MRLTLYVFWVCFWISSVVEGGRLKKKAKQKVKDKISKKKEKAKERIKKKVGLSKKPKNESSSSSASDDSEWLPDVSEWLPDDSESMSYASEASALSEILEGPTSDLKIFLLIPLIGCLVAVCVGVLIGIVCTKKMEGRDSEDKEDEDLGSRED